ncbi:tRNA (adenosine(37)-N6)-threonylcarbamoyltransferase complex dimerization subunit type 1 TsaB [Manganibacter manganicus]|uniref:tRNA N6-adenosine(37)-N6-threonylcarbamoyltransferase complex dimerization subunit TsaB n=1 Tax=Manganibacter manganicus TaxID=1873176 RepID=A0A1V8RNQ9_9HYPH|nr:tRNA (adenosine(37)-N6)-threonylcarbamoyltransferase complex dimerization subunit type 1 TsaB [Pseudaminobacter manganicus]OQM74831.1 tRNA N6-adenosine(37)-N6-threonylcarbamoyltransferase complex dimerization subunit TsaB [Pseudaminobacter manganicus]
MILAIDCSASLCAACIYDERAGRELGRNVLDLGKGHAEHLLVVIAEALTAAGIAYADLSAIAVSVGPGSFTGVRVGVATARGLALALNIPAIGVTTLEALASEARESFAGRAVLAAMDGGRGEIHAALYDANGSERVAPAVLTLDDAIAAAGDLSPVLVGTAAQAIAEAAVVDLDIASQAATADIAVYARVAAGKGSDGEKPRPVYLREADAKPQAGFVLPRR